MFKIRQSYQMTVICLMCIGLMTACGNSSVKNDEVVSLKDTVTEVINKPVLPDSVEGEFFGSVIKRKRGDYMAVLRELEDRKVLAGLKIKSIIEPQTNDKSIVSPF